MIFKRLKNNKKGFTLVEIIVVLVIIGILMALAVPAIMKYIDDAAETKVQSQVRAGFIAAQSYGTSEVGKTPGIADDALEAKITKDAVNAELGLAGTEDEAIETITCEVTSKKIDSCEIKVKGSANTYTATQTKIEKKTATIGG